MTNDQPRVVSVKVPFHLRKASDASNVDAVLLWTEDVRDVLAACAGGPLPAIYALPGGFLLKPAGGAAGHWSFLRLRSLATNLFVPVDAKLEPALLPDEAAALVRDRGLVFLPGGRVLGFRPQQSLTAPQLLTCPRRPSRDWQRLPPRPPLPDRLREVLYEPPEDAPAPTPPEGAAGTADDTGHATGGGRAAEAILQEGGEGIGTEAPRPPKAGAAARLTGGAAARLGRGLARLGRMLGVEGLARMGAGLMGWAVRQVPRLTEEILGRQEAALRELLRQFREGRLEDALRLALPLQPPGHRGGAVAGDAHLPVRDTRFNLRSLLGDTTGPGALWLGGGDVWAELTHEYRKAAEDAVARADWRRAAYIWGQLLRDYRQAAAVLQRGGLHHDAAVIYLELLGDTHSAARAFEAAGDIDRALRLYRQRGDHVAAGDLLRRAGEDELALEEYRDAAWELGQRGNHLEAGNLLRERAGRSDIALEYYLAGWAYRPHGSAFGCLMHLLQARAAEEQPAALLALIGEADEFFHAPGHETAAGQFYNALAGLCAQPHLAAVGDELRDRARVGLAHKLRQRAAEETRPGFAASDLFGRTDMWHPAVVSDATFAFRAAVRHAPAPRREAGPRVRLASGKVTAVCTAAESGRVFVGFAGGDWAMFDPREGRLYREPPPAETPATITCLATNPRGDHLVVLHAPGPSRRWLVSYVAAGAGFTRFGRLDAPSGLEKPWLTPLTGGNSSFVGLWEGAGLAILAVPDLVRIKLVHRPPAGYERSGQPLSGFLAGPRDWGPQRPFVGLLWDRDSTWTFQAEADVEWSRPQPEFVWGWPLEEADCYPAPSWPRWIAVASTHSDEYDHSEMVGVGDTGQVHWMCGSRRASTPTAQGSYRVAALTAPGRVAGVQPSGIHWLRRESTDLVKWSVTVVNLEDPVFAALSPLTSELLVVCREGELVRVPVPTG
jgi:tetratricopeptide (TPR) repeat protein